MLPAPSRGVWSHPQSFLLPAVSRRCATVWIFALLRAFDVRFKHQLQIPKKPRICSWNLYWKIVAWKAKFSNCGKQKISSWSHQFQILYGPTGGSTGDVFSWRFNMASLRICKSCSERLRHWAWLLHPFCWVFFSWLGGVAQAMEKSGFHTHTIHVWQIYLHFVDFYGKCR